MMGRGSKALIMGSILVLIVSGWLFSCQQRPSAGDRIKTEPLTVLPEDVTIVGGLEIGQISEDSLLFQTEEAKQGLEEIKAKIKLDLLKDLDRAVFGLSNVGDQEATVVALVQGRFDPAAIASALKEEFKDGKVEEKTADPYKYTLMEKGREKVAFAFPVSESFVLSNDEEALKSALQQFDKPAKSVMDNKEIASLLADVDRTSNFWLAGLMPEGVEEQVQDNPQAAALGKVKKFSVELKCTKGVDLGLAGYCASDEEATGVKDSIESSLQQFKIFFAFMPRGAEIMKFYDKITVSADGTKANLSLSLTEEEVNQLKDTLEKMKEEMEAPPEPAPAQIQ